MAENELVPHDSDQPRDNSGEPGAQQPDDPVGAGGSTDTGQQRARNAERIPTPEDCQRALHATGRLLLMDAIPPSKANALRGIDSALYDQQVGHHGVAGGTSRRDTEGLLAASRANPQLARVLETFLLTEEIADLMARARET